MRYKFIGLLLLTLFITGSLSAQQKLREIPLYEKNIPNSTPGKDLETSKIKGGMLMISKVRKPTLSIFLPPQEKANGTAVVICPGGGYWFLAAGHEGYDVARRFNDMGVAAFVLKYRIPDSTVSPHPEIAPLQDAQQALRLVRKRAVEWNVDPRKVGIMGFSAGGHLASTAGTHFEKTWIENPEGISVRPDFLMLIYPVISADTSISHAGSFKALLGNQASPELIQSYSNETRVTTRTPPTFLVHTFDDQTVSPLNSVVFYQALLKYKVPAEMHLYQSGVHGFGMKNPTTRDQWMDRARNWLESGDFLPKKPRKPATKK
jgi:acetyl esterase/lipase